MNKSKKEKNNELKEMAEIKLKIWNKAIGSDSDVIIEAETKKLLRGLKELKSSEKFHEFSDMTKRKINLQIRAYEGDSIALIELSELMGLKYGCEN